MSVDCQGTSLWLTTSNASLSGFKPPVDYILLRAGQFGEGAYFCNQSGQPNSVCNNMENPQYLAETQPNFYRIWFACNVTGCTQSLGNETLSLVYATTDTKIFKVGLIVIHKPACGRVWLVHHAPGRILLRRLENRDGLLFRPPAMRI